VPVADDGSLLVDANGNPIDPPADSASTAKSSSSGGGLSPLAIGGIVAGGIVVALLVAASIVRWTRSGRNRRFKELDLGDDSLLGLPPLTGPSATDSNPFIRTTAASSGLVNDPWLRRSPTSNSSDYNGAPSTAAMSYGMGPHAAVPAVPIYESTALPMPPPRSYAHTPPSTATHHYQDF